MLNHLGKLVAAVLGLLTVNALPAFSQSPNFRALTLDEKITSGTMRGTTGGSTSLPAIVSNRDRNKRACLGFGDPDPDHTLVLQQPVSKLVIRVNSGGADTTLAIVGPDGIVRCGDDSGSGKDASIEDTNWAAGTYQIWVGTVQPNVSRDYRLVVREN